MIPGPNRILKTPLNGSLIKVRTLTSGNTFGARYWTDGKQEAPMLPRQPWLQVVPATGELFWTDECEQIGEEKFWDETNEFAAVPYAEKPVIEDYLRSLSDGIASSHEKQRYVRTQLCWAANDPVRQGEIANPSFSGHHENLKCLLELLNASDPNQRLMAAEACREMGEFTRAAELLTFRFPKEYQRAVDLIKTLNDQQDSIVREL